VPLDWKDILDIVSLIGNICIIVITYYTLGFGYLDQTRDLPIAFRKNAVAIEGEVYNLKTTSSTQEFSVENEVFIVNKDYFIEVRSENIYEVFYLPNSKHVINVIDNNGNSLLLE